MTWGLWVNRGRIPVDRRKHKILILVLSCEMQRGWEVICYPDRNVAPPFSTMPNTWLLAGNLCIRKTKVNMNLRILSGIQWVSFQSLHRHPAGPNMWLPIYILWDSEFEVFWPVEKRLRFNSNTQGKLENNGGGNRFWGGENGRKMTGCYAV